MRAAVVSHGEVKDFDYLKSILNECDIIVCADGGAEYVIACGMVPDAVIGDLDSINNGTLNRLRGMDTNIIKYPREKDYTDTQLAINHSIEAGCSEIVLLGSIGDRLDHTLANILLLVKLIKRNIKAWIINEKNIIYITDSYLSLEGKIGDNVSLIPVGGDVKGVYTQGLQYQLSGGNLGLGDPLGISNVFIDRRINIKIDSGYLLVIKSID